MLNREKNAAFIKMLIMVGVFGLGLGVVGEAQAVTYQSRVGVGFTFESSINVSLSSSNLKIMDLMPGTVADSNTITVNVLTNNANGYVLNSTVGSNSSANDNGAIYNTRQLIHDTYTATDNTAISGGTGTKPIFSSLAYGADLAEITEGNQWGYSYLDPGDNNTNTTWSSYSGLPLYSDTTNIATLKSKDTPSTETGDKVSFKIAAKASNGQTSGEYNNVINFLVVGNPDQGGTQTTEAGCIRYYPNGSNVEGTMACQPITATDTSATLYPSNFSREGYGFAGWSDVYDYTTNPNAHFYGPNEDIAFTAGQYTSPNDGLSLYAVWVKSQGSIQDTTKVAQVCSSLTQSGPSITKTLNSVSALTDQRDGNTYAIAKLADGKCWMIENLRLDNTAEHNSDGTLAQGYGTSATYGNFGGLANPESTGFSSTYSANSLYSNDGSNNTINIGTSNYPAYRMPRYNNLNTSARGTNTTTDQNIYSYGNYYTWHAAIADLTYNGTNNQSTTGTSLCPTGWHLPTGGNASAAGATTGVNVTGDTSTFREFYNLGYTIMGSNKTAYEVTPSSGYGYYAYYSSDTTNPDGKTGTAAFRSFPNNFLYSGGFTTSSANYRGSRGYYWSSTAYDSDYSYYLYLNSSGVDPGTYTSSKYYGRSIRCVAGS